MFIRVDCDSPFNGKMARLRHACGMAGFGSLVTLWCWCGIYRPNGSLAGLRDEEIEQIALWSGAPGLLVISLKSCGLLDGDSERFTIHDWKSTQDYFAQLHRRKQDATRQKRLRMSRSVTRDNHAASRANVTPQIEREIEKEKDQKQVRVKTGRAKTALVYSPEFLEFWKPYPKKVGKWAAYAEWRKASPPLADVLAALAWQVQSERWTEDAGKYIPDPERYIKKRRWEDERPAREATYSFGQERFDQKGNLIVGAQ